MSPTIKKHLRAIDRIKVSGVPVPMTVYTFDIYNYVKGVFTPRVRGGRQASCDFFDDNQYAELQLGMDPMFLPKFREAPLDGHGTFLRATLQVLLLIC